MKTKTKAAKPFEVLSPLHIGGPDDVFDRISTALNDLDNRLQAVEQALEKAGLLSVVLLDDGTKVRI